MKVRAHAGAERRKQTILATARAMLNHEPLSMRRLAEAAGVSQATPYNLFGTKRQLFVELYAQQRMTLIRNLAASEHPHALSRMFHAIQLFGEELSAEPMFFRSLFAIIYASDPEDKAQQYTEPGAAFWLDLVKDIVAEGLLHQSVKPEAFATNFVYLLSGATIDWVNNRVTIEQWKAAVDYGLTLSALAVASDKVRPELEERLKRHDCMSG
ncbi:hypothetical protein MB02_07245 [Croceicoccus estronivorus]|uniref:TetR/AcrR family transcriptional regulator n=1 Tax=Croceicoccus estronivorus TaxID=1172626 RepID=UPI00082F880A|nr:helix-turn-helix domain-containing protein [Croceicoccus estronivorus]OCC24372.1 hypothetical protein MB02_07245 [Croceicoccus estronivorus]